MKNRNPKPLVFRAAALACAMLAACDPTASLGPDNDSNPVPLLTTQDRTQTIVWSVETSELIYGDPGVWPYEETPAAIRGIHLESRERRDVVIGGAGGRVVSRNVQLAAGFVYYLFSPAYGTGEANGLEVRRLPVRSTATPGATGEIVLPLGVASAFDVSPNGETLLIVERPGHHLIAIDWRSGARTPLASGVHASVAVNDGPVWSPDGSLIVARTGNALLTESREVTVIEWPSANRRSIQIDAVHFPHEGLLWEIAWPSPRQPVWVGAHNAQLYWLDLSTGRPGTLGALAVKNLELGSLAWSPDGRRLAYWTERCLEREDTLFGGVACTHAERELHWGGASGNVDRVLARVTERGSGNGLPASKPIFSPDGRWLGFAVPGGFSVTRTEQ